jgi:hypothetical protein
VWKRMMKDKVDNVRFRRYVEAVLVSAFTSFFAVMKGDDDIRMVFNGTLSGLNSALWAPWFCLPTATTHMRIFEPRTFMADVGIGEMFLNFFLDPRIRLFAGVDFTKFYPEELDETKKVIWERCNQCAMCFRPCPFVTIQSLAWLEENFFGNRNDLENVFHWESLKMNLMGSATYDPRKPWAYKERECDGKIATDCLVYVDDLRPTGPSEEECWRATRRVGCQLNHHGLQDATRKRRPVAQVGVPWTGTFVHTTNDRESVMVTEKRWIKT